MIAALVLLALREAPAADGRGLVLHEEGAYEGYTLFSPLRDTTTYLIGMDGRTVHTWASEESPGNAVYLTDEGHLIRCERLSNPTFSGGGQGGRIVERAWDGEVLWSHDLSTPALLAHHDIEPLPNGNLLVIAWELRSAADAIAAGRDPEHTNPDDFWPDVVLELRPVRPDGAEVVWQWHAFDHTVQDFDPEQGGYASPADHPERIDINGDHRLDRPVTAEERERQAELEREMRALGYLGDDGEDEGDTGGAAEFGRGRRSAGDWLHTNSIDYRADLDLIVLSVRTFDELWVIDHSTTTEEARTGTGGRWGRGGDLLYRWGNPRMHGAGDEADQLLFGQHDVQWIPPGCPGAGNLLVFNNGEARAEVPYSSVDEIEPPLDPERGFVWPAGGGWSPRAASWTYTAPDETSFWSSFVSGAQRLPNGNTLVCEGTTGRLFEVTPDGDTVWEYLNPFSSERPPERERGGPERGDRGDRDDHDASGADRPGRRNTPYGLFRATRLPPDHPGLARLVITPEDE